MKRERKREGDCPSFGLSRGRADVDASSLFFFLFSTSPLRKKETNLPLMPVDLPGSGAVRVDTPHRGNPL